MEPLPVRPTTVPQARKYSRTFKTNASRDFTGQDTVTIDIPPIARSYLTKNARIYFTMNMSFYDDSTSSPGRQNLPAGWFSQEFAQWNCLRKPVPMLDVCGPYGFIRKMEIRDYLGNTLIEKIDRHDLMASMMSDFYLDNEVDRLRETVSDQRAYYATPYPDIVTKVNGINLLDPYRAKLSSVESTTFYEYVEQPPQEIPLEVDCPTWNFSIDLLGFLGRGSQKFVPLHNGFRIVLELNNPNVPIKFALPSGSLTMSYKDANSLIQYYTLKPSISNFSISDMYLRGDILEVSPELDERVDKVIHTQMVSHYELGKCEVPTIVPGNYLSASSMKIACRIIPYEKSFSELGFRSRTNIVGAKLLYNDAVHQEYNSPYEILLAMGPTFDPSILPQSFYANGPSKNETGTDGYIYPYPNVDFKAQLETTNFSTTANFKWVNNRTTSPDRNETFYRYNDNAGKFLIPFDLTLNGYKDSQISGIDTTKTTIKLNLIRSTKDSDTYITDVFTEFDAIITIKPGVSTSVSF